MKMWDFVVCNVPNDGLVPVDPLVTHIHLIEQRSGKWLGAVHMGQQPLSSFP